MLAVEAADWQTGDGSRRTDSCTDVINVRNQTVNDGVAHSKNAKKCAYHVTSDLHLDLEHTLDAGDL